MLVFSTDPGVVRTCYTKPLFVWYIFQLRFATYLWSYLQQICGHKVGYNMLQ